MKTKVQKWGNSLALRIPRALAADAKVDVGSAVELTLENGKLVIESIEEPHYDLEDLLAGVKESNMHGEISTGTRKGHEVW